jgi:hypothetical protein
VAEERAAAHALAVEDYVDFNGAWPGAFELNLQRAHWAGATERKQHHPRCLQRCTARCTTHNQSKARQPHPTWYSPLPLSSTHASVTSPLNSSSSTPAMRRAWPEAGNSNYCKTTDVLLLLLPLKPLPWSSVSRRKG